VIKVKEGKPDDSQNDVGERDQINSKSLGPQAVQGQVLIKWPGPKIRYGGKRVKT